MITCKASALNLKAFLRLPFDLIPQTGFLAKPEKQLKGLEIRVR